MALIYTRLIVNEFEKALVYANGRYVRTVGPGRHVLWRVPFVLRQTAEVIDVRKQSITLMGQEILTKDRVPVRLTLATTYQITDPVAALHNVDYWSQQLYLDVQLALREIVTTLSFDELLDQKTALGDQVRDNAQAQTSEYGVTVLRAAVKDVTVPASIREMMLKSVEAEKSTEASLIKAREEVAAARTRANAAKLIADNPAVLRLKKLETLTELAKSPGSTVVFAGSTDLHGLLKTATTKDSNK